MKFITATEKDGSTIYLNPAHIEQVRDLPSGRAHIIFVSGFVHVTETPEIIVARINATSK